MSIPRAIEFADGWKRRCLLAIIVLAAMIALCVLLAAVLCAYSQSHYDYLTRAPASMQPENPA